MAESTQSTIVQESVDYGVDHTTEIEVENIIENKVESKIENKVENIIENKVESKIENKVESEVKGNVVLVSASDGVVLPNLPPMFEQIMPIPRRAYPDCTLRHGEYMFEFRLLADKNRLRISIGEANRYETGLCTDEPDIPSSAVDIVLDSVVDSVVLKDNVIKQLREISEIYQKMSAICMGFYKVEIYNLLIDCIEYMRENLPYMVCNLYKKLNHL